MRGWRTQVYSDWSALLCIQNAHTSPVAISLSIHLFPTTHDILRECLLFFCRQSVKGLLYERKNKRFQKVYTARLDYSTHPSTMKEI